MIQNHWTNCYKLVFPIVAGLLLLGRSVNAQSVDTAENSETEMLPLQTETVSSTPIPPQDTRESSAVYTTDLFQQQPGIFIQKPVSSAGSLSLRGLGGDRNLVVIDGVRFSNGIYGTYPNGVLSDISPYTIHSATVHKGPNAFHYANGTTGGVIDVSTVSPKALPEGVHGQGQFLYSSGTHTPGISVDSAVVRETHAIAMGADYFSFGQLRVGEGDQLPYTEATHINWRTKIVLEPKDSPLTVTGSYIGHVGLNNIRTDQLGLGTIHIHENSDNLVTVDLSWKPHPRVKKLKIVASYHQTIENGDRYNCFILGAKAVIHQPSCETLVSANNAQKTRDIIDTFGIDASSRFSFLNERLHLFGNIEYYFDNVISSMQEARIVHGSSDSAFLSQNRGLYSSGSYLSKFGTSLGAEGRLLQTKAGDLIALISGRFSNIAAYAPVVPEIEEDIHYSHSAFTDSAGLSWNKDDIFTLYGMYAAGFRAPSLQESTSLGYIAGQYQIPNVNLEPELSNNFELGTTLEVKAVKLGAAWFHNRIDNYIDERPAAWGGEYYSKEDGTPIVQRQNAESAVFEGVESALEIRIRAFTVSADISWVRGEITGNNDDLMNTLTGNATSFPARRSPRLFGSSTLRYDHTDARFFTAFSIDWADKQTELHPLDKTDLSICGSPSRRGALKSNCNSFAGYYSLNLEGGVKITPNADLMLSARNLTDNRYTLIGSGQPSPGFDARTVIRLHF